MRAIQSIGRVVLLTLMGFGIAQCGALDPDVPGPARPPRARAAAAPPDAHDGPAAAAHAAAPAAEAHQAAPAVDSHHAAPAHGGAPHWSYSGDEGPAKWGDLSPEFGACKAGVSQSPIDIVTQKTEADKTLGVIDFRYGPPMPLRILNNGHTIQVQSVGAATIRAGGRDWKLVQVHFHAPSEHAINGKLAAFEAHFVHANDKGELAVVGLLYKQGQENKALVNILDHMPDEVTTEPFPVPGTKIELTKLLPDRPSYFAYPGSLTTPKCTEGVSWFVLEPTSELSQAQLEKFQSMIHGGNNRPVQPLGARKIVRAN